jgi:hypothetical protein
LVHASGTAGKRPSGTGEWVYQFEQHPRDFAPFAAGGKYAEQQFRAQGEDIFFWTLGPVDSARAKTAAEAIAHRVHYYEGEYGRRRDGGHAIRLLECVIPDQRFGCGALPETVLVHQAWVARGLKDKDFFNDAGFELAYTWFGGVSKVRFDLYPLPMDALAPYAGWQSQAIEEGGEARQSRIRTLLGQFDKQAAGCREKVILPLPAGDHGCSYSAAWAKSALLFFALEDKVGRAQLHKAMRQMIQARRAQDFGIEDLIASLEAETQLPQGEFVRLWMKYSGIPDEFRARYAVAAAPADNSSEEPKP